MFKVEIPFEEDVANNLKEGAHLIEPILDPPITISPLSTIAAIKAANSELT